MQRIQNLKEAVVLAALVCDEWVRADDEKHEERFDRAALAAYASRDGNGSTDKDSFYIISTEGAIGLAQGREYRTKWLFLPAEDFPTPAPARRRSLVTPSAKAPAESVPAESVPRPQTVQTIRPASGLRFCNNCGVALKPDVKFCMECGKPV